MSQEPKAATNAVSGTEGDLDVGPVKVGDLFERYQILKLLGQGGYASVYHARREFIDRDVAIKISNRSVTREVFRRFQAEARLTHKLRHPNIVEVFDADVASSGHLYIVMELLRGQTFWDAQQQHGKLTIVEALILSAQVAEGVEQAHRVGAIHRDLKPLNLFIAENNHVKVLDFGIAKLADGDGSSTQRNLIHGTLKYMSPEQLMAKPLTPRSDVYALGVIVFELLTGQHPSIVENAQLTETELGWAIIARPAPALDEIDPKVPDYLAHAVQRALNKQPEQRFDSMAEFAAVLRECYERYIRDFGDVGQARALWLPVLSPSVVAHRALSASQEHTATAVVGVVPPKSMRPPSVSTTRQDTRRNRLLMLRRIVPIGAAIGLAIGIVVATRTGRSPAPPTVSAATTPSNTRGPRAPTAVVDTGSAFPTSANDVGPTAVSTSQKPKTSASSTPAGPPKRPLSRPSVMARPGSRLQSTENKSQDWLNWFEEDNRNANRAAAKSGL